jgi:hypothetical protein
MSGRRVLILADHDTTYHVRGTQFGWDYREERQPYVPI